MLVLSRELNEDIMIGDNVVIRVLSIEKGRVRLGLTAPANVTIMRGELGAPRTKEKPVKRGLERQAKGRPGPAK